MANSKTTLIIGDVHCKTEMVLPLVDLAISKYKVEKVVFVGDYFDEWNVTAETIYDEINKLIEWRNNKIDNGVEIVLLMGNHDYAYIDPFSSCSGHHFDAEPFAFRRLTEYMDIQAADVVGDKYLVTHAGVSSLYADEFLKGLNTPQEIADELNNKLDIAIDLAKKIKNGGLSRNDFPPMLLGTLGWCGSERGGRDKFSGPFWCGYNELNNNKLPKVSQIVGHTPTKTIISTLVNDDDSDAYAIYWCDTFTVAPNMKPMGDKSFLLLDDDILNIVIPVIDKDNNSKIELSSTPINV